MSFVATYAAFLPEAPITPPPVTMNKDTNYNNFREVLWFPKCSKLTLVFLLSCTTCQKDDFSRILILSHVEVALFNKMYTLDTKLL